jgi:hypothetical protein
MLPMTFALESRVSFGTASAFEAETWWKTALRRRQPLQRSSNAAEPSNSA